MKYRLLALLLFVCILGILGSSFLESPVYALTTSTWQVGQSSDDCMRQLVPSGWYLTGWWVTAGDYGDTSYDYRGGMRWTNINIPQGVTIVSAKLILRAYTWYGLSLPTTYIEGEATDNATTFSTAADYDARTRTSASVSWTPSAWVYNTWYNSTDIKTVIQEIVNRPGWVSGNALVLFWRDANGFVEQQRLDAYDWGDDPASAPKLEVTWTYNPTNDGCSAQDLDSGNVLAWRKYYSFYVTATDADGVADFNYVELRFEYPAGTYSNVILRWTESTNTFSIQAGSAYIGQSGSTKATSGNQVQLTFKVAFDWDYPLTSDIDAQVYSLDDYGASDTDTFNLNMGFINTVTTTPSSNDARQNVGGTVTISGTVVYSGTSIALPTSQITSIVVHDSSHTNKGSTGSNPYSIGITLPSTVGSNAYHIYVDGSDSDFSDGDKGSSVSVISDRIEVYQKDDPIVTFSPSEFVYSSDPIVGPQNWYNLISALFIPLMFLALLINKLPRRFSVPKPKREWLAFLFLIFLFCSCFLLCFSNVPTVKAQEPQQKVFGNPSLPDWKNITVTVAGDGKSFTLNNADNLTWIFEYGANKYNSIYQSGVQIVKDELWMLQVYDGSWKDIGSSVNVFYQQVTSYNVRVTQTYTSKNGDYNVTWDFYGGFRPKISFSVNITVAGNYRVDWRTYVYKDYAMNMTNYVKFWNGVEEAVVFDYSDVYMTFGNITSIEGVEGWVKGKRFDLIFNVGSLPIGLFGLDPTFGYTTAGASSYGVTTNVMCGSLFTSPSDVGTAQSVTFYYKQCPLEGGYVKGVLVRHSDLSIIPNGIGDPISLTAGQTGWFTSTFSTAPTLSPNTDYVLMIVISLGTSYLYYDAGATNQGHVDATNSYASPTNPTDATHNDYKYSIYCTYTVGGDTQAPTYSNIAHNTTIASNPCQFSCKWTDNTGLSGYVFSWNSSGSWQNNTWTALSGNPAWANVTKTLNSTVGLIIGYRWYCNDTSNNWNSTTIQTLTTTYSASPQYSNIATNTTHFGWTCQFSSYWTDDQALSGYIFGTNNTGTWVNETWASLSGTASWANVTKTLSSLVGARVEYQWWCNDSQGQWNNTGIQYLIITTSATPTFSNIASNTTLANNPCLFSVYWSDDLGLSGYIFGTNNTGSWVNETWTSLSGATSWANITKTLTLSVGVRVEFRWWCNDTDNNWNDTSIQFLITTNPTAPTYSNIATSTTNASASCTFSVLWTDNVQLSGFIFSTNNTGQWINETWSSLSGTSAWANVTKTLNSTIHIYVSFRWFCNDTGNNWADTGIQTIYLTSHKETSVPANSYVIIWFKARYDYDDTAYTSASGSTLSINGTLATYDSVAGYWWINVTQNFGNYTYVVSAVSDGVYGLTALYDAVGGVTIEWQVPGVDPVNDSCTFLDLDNETILARYKHYSIEVNITDDDGPLNLNYVELRLEYSEGNYTIIVRWTESMNTFTVTSGSNYIDENGSSNSTEGNRTILTFKIRFDWDYPLSSDLDCQVYSLDDYSRSDTDNYDRNVDVKKELTFSSFNCDDDRGNIEQSLTFTGSVYYSGTAYSPLDSEITNIQIHDSSHNNEGQGTTTNGAFSIEVTAKSTAQSTTYHGYINGEGDYPDGDVSGVTDFFITDSLTTFNIQSVTYLGDGVYQYEAQVKYAYDNNSVAGAYVNVSLPSGVAIGQLTSNSSGWFTFVLSQTNATEGGTYTIYGVNDNNYGVTVAGSNQTLSLYSWTFNPQDVEGNSLTNTTITVSKTSTSIWSGASSEIRVPQDTFNVSIAWLQDLAVNTTNDITVSNNLESNFSCLCYPFTVSNTVYWVASNATISSKTYVGNLLTLEFNSSEATYILVSNYATKPSYILNCTYNYATCFTPYDYLVLTHYSNATITISYIGWGGVNVQKTNQLLAEASWSGEQLNLNFTGEGGQTGEVEIYCSTRGTPSSYEGFNTGSYSSSTKVFTGTYVFSSSKTVSVTWLVTGSETPSIGRSTSFSNLLVAIDLLFNPTMRAGSTVPGTIKVRWSGPQSIFVYDVKFGENMTWFTIEGLPLKLSKERSIVQGEAYVNVTVTIPKNALAKKYELPCIVTFQTEGGQNVVIGGLLEFEVLALPSTIPEYMTLLFLGVIGSILLVGFFRKRRQP